MAKTTTTNRLTARKAATLRTGLMRWLDARGGAAKLPDASAWWKRRAGAPLTLATCDRLGIAVSEFAGLDVMSDRAALAALDAYRAEVAADAPTRWRVLLADGYGTEATTLRDMTRAAVVAWLRARAATDRQEADAMEDPGLRLVAAVAVAVASERAPLAVRFGYGADPRDLPEVHVA